MCTNKYYNYNYNNVADAHGAGGGGGVGGDAVEDGGVRWGDGHGLPQ